MKVSHPSGLVEEKIRNNTICLFGNTQCTRTEKAIKFLDRYGTPYEKCILDRLGALANQANQAKNVDVLPPSLYLVDTGQAMRAYLEAKTGHVSTPFVFIDGEFVGGFEGRLWGRLESPEIRLSKLTKIHFHLPSTEVHKERMRGRLDRHIAKAGAPGGELPEHLQKQVEKHKEAQFKSPIGQIQSGTGPIDLDSTQVKKKPE